LYDAISDVKIRLLLELDEQPIGSAISVGPSMKSHTAKRTIKRGILSTGMMGLSRSGFLSAAIVSSICWALLGCHRAGRPMIAIIPTTTAQEVWESAHVEASRIASTWGWDTFWSGPSREDDLLRQIQIMDKEVNQGVAGIILVPDHAVALISPVRAAVEKNIPVAILDNPLAAWPKENVVFVLNDNAATGRLAAERVSHYLKGTHKEVAILGVHPNFLGTIIVADTIKDELQRNNPGIRFIEQRSTFGPTEAEDSADELLQVHPALQAIVTLNVNQTRAVYNALSRAKLLGKIGLIGCEQDFDIIYRVRTGEMDSVVAKDTGTMVRDAMQWIHQRREGVVTGETIVVAPKLVTRQNVDSPEIQRILAVSGSAR
jgi:ribose transport system substrate-binding protein